MRFPRVRRALRIAVAIAAIGFAIVCHTWITLPDVRPLARTPPASTAFMRLRESQAAAEGVTVRRRQRWVSYNAISPHGLCTVKRFVRSLHERSDPGHAQRGRRYPNADGHGESAVRRG